MSSADPARQPLLSSQQHDAPAANGTHPHGHDDSTLKRFLKALAICALALLLGAALVTSITDWPFGGGKREPPKPVAYASYPADVDGDIIACYQHQYGLDFHGTHDKWTDTEVSGAQSRTAKASIDLPLNLAEIITFVARGNAVQGTVVIEDASGSDATARVQVEWNPDMVTDSEYLFQVCNLWHRNRGGPVMGLYLPNWSANVPAGFEPTRTVLTISVPPGTVKNLKTETWYYNHDLRVSDKVTFANIDLNSQFGEIDGYLTAESLTLKSINHHVFGNYTVSRKASLHTSNAPIDAQVALGSSAIRVPTLNLGTSNAAIRGSVRLVGAHAFDAVLRTSNDEIDFKVASMPLNHKLEIDAQTSNAPARLALPLSYEGVIVQEAAGGPVPELTVALVHDPAGLGRHHEIRTINIGKDNRTEHVSWGVSGGQGKVLLRTSNARAGVDITENWK